jgi:hypothetical protein
MRKLRRFAVSTRQNHHDMRSVHFGHAPSRPFRIIVNQLGRVWLMCGADVGSLVVSQWRGLASTMWSEEAGVWSWHRVC